MKRFLIIGATLAALLSPAKAADSTVTLMTAASALTGPELLYCVQSAADRKCTATQMAAFVYGLMSGDATASGTGAVTFATVNANVGSFGSATQCVALTVNAKGLITAASASTCAPAIGSVTGLGTGVATALGVNVGSAGAFVTFNGALGTPSAGTLTNATGLPIAGVIGPSGGGVQCLHTSNTGVITGTASDCGSAAGLTSLTPGGGLVSSVTAAYSQTAITTTGTVSGAEAVNAQVGTSYAILDGDRAKLVTGTNASAQAYTIAQAGAASAFVTGWYVDVFNKGAGSLTITPTTSTINGAASLTLFSGQGIRIVSDGTNYQINPGATGAIATSTQSGANYAFAASDFGKVVYLNNGSNQIPTIAQAGTVGFNAGWFVTACNIGAGTQTATPTTSTIGGASTYVLRAGSAAAPVCATVISDGTNYTLVVDQQAAIGTSGATVPLLNGTNTFSGTQTFGATVGTVTTQSGTTYTFASTDCGTTVRFTNASAVTATIPQGLATGCVIAVEQAGAGAVSVNGSAVTPATLHSAHSYTKTFAQWAVIGIFTESSNVAILTGDGA